MYMYPPKVTTNERGNLVGIQQGAMVYNTDLDRLWFIMVLSGRIVTLQSEI